MVTHSRTGENGDSSSGVDTRVLRLIRRWLKVGVSHEGVLEETIPEMETGASDSIGADAAGIPSYEISGVAADHDDIRAHDKDERPRLSSYYDGVEFYYAT